MAYPYQIDKNCIPQCDVFLENGYTKEEMKLTNETKKILDPDVNVSATAVRVPVVGGHSEAVNIEFEHEFQLEELREVLSKMSGVVVLDDPSKQVYPMPIHAEGKNRFLLDVSVAMILKLKQLIFGLSLTTSERRQQMRYNCKAHSDFPLNYSIQCVCILPLVFHRHLFWHTLNATKHKI